MTDTERLAELVEERDLVAAAMKAEAGKGVQKFTIRGREVEYSDALKHRQYLDEAIDRLESKVNRSRCGPARNKARLGRA